MDLQTIFQLKAAEKAAKDAFYASANSNTQVDQRLYEAMIAATKARQHALSAFALEVV